jgi:hypothetical protein
MLLRADDFVSNKTISFEGLDIEEETFVRPYNNNRDMFIHRLTLHFLSGHYEEFFCVRDARYSFDAIMRQINDLKGGRHPNTDMKKYLDKLGEIIGGELHEIIVVDSYMVYIQKEEKISE